MSEKSSFNYLASRLVRIALSLSILLTAPVFGAAPRTAIAQKGASITILQPSGTMGSVMKAVEQQTGLHFFYNDQDVNPAEPMSVHVEQGSLEEVFTAFREKGLSCKVSNGLIVLSRNNNAQQANTINIKGQVVDSDGFPVIAATIVVMGVEGKGAATDLDGNFSINGIPADATLRVSYIGMITQEVPVNGQTYLTITLREDSELLDEVVVVGYGVQKKSVVTGSIAQVSADDLLAKSPVRMDNALKGLAAGVNVTSASGQPGAQPRIIIRGNGTINDNTPLFLVDGMPIEGGLDYLNPNDIQSIEVLKDAASAAIYGSRGSNGVILVTTKKGAEGAAVVNYNFSYGWQSPWHHRDLTSATDYAILQNEMRLNAGQAPLYADPYNLKDNNGDPIVGFGTDWQSLVFNENAPVMNHDVTVSGASEKVNYYVSIGYFEQDGIVGGNYGQSNYDRLTLRSNTSYDVFDKVNERNFLNKLTLTSNLSYAKINSTGIAENTEYGSVLGSALYLAPILSPTATNPELIEAMETAYAGHDLFRDENGNPYTIPGFGGGYQEMNNPLAVLQIPPSKGWSHKFVANFSLALNIWDNLKYKISFSPDLSFWGNDGAVTSKYYLSGNNKQTHTSASSYKAQGITWLLENVLSYDKKIDEHSFSILLGQSAQKSKNSDLGGSRWNLVNVNKPSINYATGDVIVDADGNATVQHSVYGGPWAEHRLASVFGRLDYNYAERYILQLTVRRDGSSRFGANHKYGTFPSASLGWNIANEPYMQDILPSWLSAAKLRMSWGKNGNERIGDFRYTVNNAMGNNYLFGKVTSMSIGSKASGLPNPDLRWEESEQTDIGLDLGMLNGALTFSVDYFNKRTNGMIIEMPIPGYVGESAPLDNIGKMENKGWEFELGYRWNISDATFSVKGNASYLQNKLIYLGNTSGYLSFDGVQGIQGGAVSRAENGKPFPFYYGFKTDGVFQTIDEVNAYTNADGSLIQPKARPGDVRFVDVDGDGVITPDDRTDIGNGTPKWTFGLDFNAAWRGLDLNLFFQGVSGVDVFDATHRNDVLAGNFPTWMLDRWTGPGTSNKYPILRLNDDLNWQVSDLYVCDGSYLRLKNIQLGYTLPKEITEKALINRLRMYVMAENLFTWTKYWGFDPEISSGGTSLGIDRGIYPQARTFTVGLNLTF
ncbi:MAG: TonB-dependent receptor [Porphyromonas sp.]|nr:TonB-dependent receptor [Porphyromonas sp.]